MSYRNWYIAVALGIALSNPAWAAPPDQKTEQQNASPSIQSEQQSPTAKDQAKRPNYNLDSCYQNQSRENADLCAQWRSAIAAEKTTEYARWANWISGAGAILSFVGTILVLIAIGVAYQANKISREIGERQIRSYLAVEKVKIKWKPVIGGKRKIVYGDFSVGWKNSGQSPARDVGMVALARVAPIETWDNPVPDFAKAKDGVKFGTNTFAVGEIKWCSYSPENEHKWLTPEETDDWLENRSAFLIYSQVRYRDVFGKERYAETCQRAVYDHGEDDTGGKIRFMDHPHHNYDD